jgi:hypothetical protein
MDDENDFEFDADVCAELMIEYGIVDAGPAALARNECDCSGEPVKMTSMNEFLICNLCGSIKESHNDVGGSIAKGPSTYQIGSRTYTCYGTAPRDKSDKVADLFNYLKNLISSNGYFIDPELLGESAAIMQDVASHNIWKKSNRISLAAVSIYLTSIKQGKIMTYKEIKALFSNKKFKFSKGMKIISNALLYGNIEPERLAIGEKIHDQLISKYLKIYDPEFYLEDGNVMDRNINTIANRKFCITVIEVMLKQNIAYNAVIQSKCIAVVYYLIKNKYNHENESAQRKYFSSIVDMGENTYIRVYNTLISTDTQRVLRESGLFR